MNSEAVLLHNDIELDEIVNGAKEDKEIVEASTVGKSAPPDTISGGDSVIPPVVYTLASLLPQFEGDDLESQLQSYDTFIAVLPPTARKAISDLLKEAAKSTSNPGSKARIEKAAESIAQGGRASEPYDHDAAMKKYMEEHKKSYQ